MLSYRDWLRETQKASVLSPPIGYQQLWYFRLSPDLDAPVMRRRSGGARKLGTVSGPLALRTATEISFYNAATSPG